MPQGGWVPVEWFEIIVSLLFGALAFLWLGITYRVYVTIERRLLTAEAYMDPRSEDIRNRLLMSQFEKLIIQLKLDLARDLEAKRTSIEGTITQMGSEVVRAVKQNGGAK